MATVGTVETVVPVGTVETVGTVVTVVTVGTVETVGTVGLVLLYFSTHVSESEFRAHSI